MAGAHFLTLVVIALLFVTLRVLRARREKQERLADILIDKLQRIPIDKFEHAGRVLRNSLRCV